MSFLDLELLHDLSLSLSHEISPLLGISLLLLKHWSSYLHHPQINEFLRNNRKATDIRFKQGSANEEAMDTVPHYFKTSSLSSDKICNLPRGADFIKSCKIYRTTNALSLSVFNAPISKVSRPITHRVDCICICLLTYHQDIATNEVHAGYAVLTARIFFVVLLLRHGPTH